MSTEYQEAGISFSASMMCVQMKDADFFCDTPFGCFGGGPFAVVICKDVQLTSLHQYLLITSSYSLAPKSVMVGELYTVVIISIFVTDCLLNFFTVCIISLSLKMYHDRRRKCHR